MLQVQGPAPQLLPVRPASPLNLGLANEQEGIREPLLLNVQVNAVDVRQQQEQAALRNFTQSPLGRLIKPEYLKQKPNFEGNENYPNSFSRIYDQTVALYKTFNHLPEGQQLTVSQERTINKILCGQRDWELPEGAPGAASSLELAAQRPSGCPRKLRTGFLVSVSGLMVWGATVFLRQAQTAHETGASNASDYDAFVAGTIVSLVGGLFCCAGSMAWYLISIPRTEIPYDVPEEAQKTVEKYLSPETQRSLHYSAHREQIEVTEQEARQLNVLHILDSMDKRGADAV